MNYSTSTVMPPLVKIKDKFQITIPTQIRKMINLEIGDILETVIQNGLIIFKPKVIYDRESVNAAVREGLEDYKSGRVYGPFASANEIDGAVEKFKKLKKRA